MITNLPFYVYAAFAVSVLFSLVQFYLASGKNLKIIAMLIGWGTFHTVLAFSGFYENTMTTPPRFTLMASLMLLIVLAFFFSSRMKDWLSGLNLKQLTYVHTVRIPVELVLFWLFVGGYVPELMTFEGINYDILMGITAPIIALIAFKGSKMNKPLLYGWNILSIILLGNIVFHAILSTPTVIQQFAFDQPNVALFYFPFLLLPAIIVPIVLIANLASFVILKRLE